MSVIRLFDYLRLVDSFSIHGLTFHMTGEGDNRSNKKRNFVEKHTHGQKVDEK